MIYNNNEIIKEQHNYRLMDYNPWDKLMIYIDNSKTKYMLKREDIVSIFKKHSLNIIIEMVYVHLMKKYMR